MTEYPDRQPETGGEDTARAAEYVLGLMDEVTRAEFEEQMAFSRDLRAEVAIWEAEFAAMAEAEVAPVAPPVRVKGRVTQTLFPDAKRAPFLMHAGFWQATTFAALALAAGLGWQIHTTPAPAPLLVGEIAAENEDRLRLLAVYDAADGTLRLSRTDGVAPPGRVLELWAIPGEDAAPVSLGLLEETAEGAVTIPEDLRDAAGQALFAISEEPPGGSPTGAPTGEVIAVGQLTGL